jgi:hypothetical protein
MPAHIKRMSRSNGDSPNREQSLSKAAGGFILSARGPLSADGRPLTVDRLPSSIACLTSARAAAR